jgi:hypothetical protein
VRNCREKRKDRRQWKEIFEAGQNPQRVVAPVKGEEGVEGREE